MIEQGRAYTLVKSCYLIIIPLRSMIRFTPSVWVVRRCALPYT